MQNTANLGLCSNGCYQPLKPVSFLWHEKCPYHPGWTQRSPLTTTEGLCALPRQRTFNPRHKYETSFTAILLKAVTWPLNTAHFCPFWERYCTTLPTVTRDAFPFAKPHLASGRSRARQKSLRANLSGVSRPSWGLPGWGCAPGAPSSGHPCLIQKASNSFRQGARSSQTAAFWTAVREQSYSANDGAGSAGSKYNQEFSHSAAVMDVASWCVSTLVSVKAWGSWNKRKQIPSKFLLSKQWGVQWANEFPVHYPIPVLPSHQAYFSTPCKCNMEKMLATGFSSSLVPLFFIFFLLSLLHTLPLSYYNLSWLAAICHLLPCW